MRRIQPLSEDFLYWSPGYKSCYQIEAGLEDAWFIDSSDTVQSRNPVTGDVEVNNENKS